MGIRNIFSDTDGTKIAFIDDHNQGFIYTPVNQFKINKKTHQNEY